MNIHTAFNLTYANYLVIDPALTAAAPAAACAQLAAMLAQLWRAYPQFGPVERVALIGEEHEFEDLSDADMLRWGVTDNLEFLHEACDCGDEPEQARNEPDADFGARYRRWEDTRWYHEHEDRRWEWEGEQWDHWMHATFPTEPLADARRANRTVVPRTLLQSMPDDWQHRFVAVLGATGASQDGKAYHVQFFGRHGQPTGDPVPHYNRGRTHIEPLAGALA